METCSCAVEGCSGAAPLVLHPREGLGRVLLELAQLVERLRLLIESGVRLLAQGDDAGVPVSDFLLGVGRRVVELLLQGERLREILLRGRERLRELGRRRVAELRLGELELLGARLHGIIRLDQSGRRAPLELLRVDLLDRLAPPAGPAAHLLPATADDEPHDDADPGGDGDEHQGCREEASAAVGGIRPARHPRPRPR